jgi:hypothetical protein
MFKTWAMPVVARRWAAATAVLYRLNRATRWHVPRLAHWTHRSWERAVGVT